MERLGGGVGWCDVPWSGLSIGGAPARKQGCDGGRRRDVEDDLPSFG